MASGKFPKKPKIFFVTIFGSIKTTQLIMYQLFAMFYRLPKSCRFKRLEILGQTVAIKMHYFADMSD